MNVINGAINKKDVDSVTTFIRYRSYKYSNLELGGRGQRTNTSETKKETLANFPKKRD